MKRFVFATLIALGSASFAMPAAAHDAYDDSQSHPLRIAAYIVHPFGWYAEWMIARPIHFLVSQPALEPIFGHVPHENPYGEYPPYEDAALSGDMAGE